ncbi:hypothetical protein BDP55DRAFT_401238 [Colletotrichum godetiae]|uniref:Secreted protein n=1 Tax=Colletotrichum godetiae TaxID=1209918 RepID=A0AAJ0EM45_9PEZI|nr:uncharacterized protein BDP55DRAFT_401238 [Colletotrichum godetiae]KAK1658275.1 hypothetical protein BDP55DRAFT_401238 [Colletotrichum godetiae]
MVATMCLLSAATSVLLRVYTKVVASGKAATTRPILTTPTSSPGNPPRRTARGSRSSWFILAPSEFHQKIASFFQAKLDIF